MAGRGWWGREEERACLLPVFLARLADELKRALQLDRRGRGASGERLRVSGAVRRRSAQAWSAAKAAACAGAQQKSRKQNWESGSMDASNGNAQPRPAGVAPRHKARAWRRTAGAEAPSSAEASAWPRDQPPAKRTGLRPSAQGCLRCAGRGASNGSPTPLFGAPSSPRQPAQGRARASWKPSSPGNDVTDVPGGCDSPSASSAPGSEGPPSTKNPTSESQSKSELSSCPAPCSAGPAAGPAPCPASAGDSARRFIAVIGCAPPHAGMPEMELDHPS